MSSATEKDAQAPKPTQPLPCPVTHPAFTIKSILAAVPAYTSLVLYDTHSHIDESLLPSSFQPVTDVSKPPTRDVTRDERVLTVLNGWKNVRKVNLMSSNDTSMRRNRYLAYLPDPSNRLVIGYGVHPWYAARLETTVDAKTLVSQYLDSHPHDHSEHPFMGEIGLDKVAFHPETKEKYDWDQQFQTFKDLMRIAKEKDLCVSAHMVKTCSVLLECWKRWEDDGKLPRALVIHSYGGSNETLNDFFRIKSARERVLISFSSLINARSPTKLYNNIQATPDECIIIESDTHDHREVEKCMLEIFEIVRKVKGWTIMQAQEILWKNSIRAFGGESWEQVKKDAPDGGVPIVSEPAADQSDVDEDWVVVNGSHDL